MHEDLIN